MLVSTAIWANSQRRTWESNPKLVGSAMWALASPRCGAVWFFLNRETREAYPLSSGKCRSKFTARKVFDRVRGAKRECCFLFAGDAFSSLATCLSLATWIRRDSNPQLACAVLVSFAVRARSVRGDGFEPSKLVGTTVWALASPRCNAERVCARLFILVGGHCPIPLESLQDSCESEKARPV
jgi:hypothetical protein